MKIEVLLERIAKAKEKITKKEGTIAKKTARIPKVDEIDAYWLQEDIRRLHKEIEETKELIKKYEGMLEDERKKEEVFANEVPQALKDLEAQMIKEWDRSDKERRKFLREEYEELGYADFVKKHTYTGYNFMHETDEEIHNDNVKSARVFVLQFVNRVKDVTGEIKGWDDVYLTVGAYGFPTLNGVVYGEKGNARVESINAGGYNIQRLHVRVLVHAIHPKNCP